MSKSEITEPGYGEKHIWKNMWANPHGNSRDTKYSNWKCTKCGVVFNHFYDKTPNIHKAIQQANIPQECIGGQNELTF